MVNVCVIYIAKFDIFEDGRSVYHVDRIVRETGKVVYNGMEEVYVNAEARDGTEVAELMQVFTEGPVYNDKFPVTSGLKKLYRDGDDEMIYTLSDKLREEGQERGLVKFAALMNKLLTEGRYEDAKRASTDPEYRDKLFIEYGIQ